MSDNQVITVPRDEVERLVKLLQYQAHPYPSPHAEFWQRLLDKPAPPQGETVECTHEWTDDGGHLLVCTACGAQVDHDPGWKDMASAPTDGTMLRLLVAFEEHPTEDADQAVTIGANNFDNDGEDNWQFAGWCWSHDHFTEGKGTPVGWLPMLDEPKARAVIQTVEAR